MAKHLCLSLHELQKLQPGGGDSDTRVLMKDGDRWNLSLFQRGTHYQLPRFSGLRELRLLAAQLLAVADFLADPVEIEVVELNE